MGCFKYKGKVFSEMELRAEIAIELLDEKVIKFAHEDNETEIVDCKTGKPKFVKGGKWSVEQ